MNNKQNCALCGNYITNDYIIVGTQRVHKTCARQFLKQIRSNKNKSNVYTDGNDVFEDPFGGL